MKRLPRILLNGVTVLSLVLCVATVVLWVRSYWVQDEIESVREKGLWAITASRGLVSVYRERIVGPYASFRNDEDSPHGIHYRPADPTVGPPPLLTQKNGRDFDLQWGAFRFAVHDTTDELWGSVFTQVLLPYWSACAALLLLPTFRVLRSAAWHRRRRKGFCPTCGYDLRATPERCPECGAVPEGVKG